MSENRVKMAEIMTIGGTRVPKVCQIADQTYRLAASSTQRVIFPFARRFFSSSVADGGDGIDSDLNTAQ